MIAPSNAENTNDFTLNNQFLFIGSYMTGASGGNWTGVRAPAASGFKILDNAWRVQESVAGGSIGTIKVSVNDNNNTLPVPKLPAENGTVYLLVKSM